MINGALFKGEQVVNAEELEDVDPKLVHQDKNEERRKIYACAKDETKMEKIIKKNQYILDKETARAILGMLGIEVNLNKVMIKTQEGAGYDIQQNYFR